jgi:hypothetical protein
MEVQIPQKRSMAGSSDESKYILIMIHKLATFHKASSSKVDASESWPEKKKK